MDDYSINQVLYSSLLCAVVVNEWVCCYSECFRHWFRLLCIPYTAYILYLYIVRIHFRMDQAIASIPQCIFHLNVEYLKIIKWNFNLWRNQYKTYDGNVGDSLRCRLNVAREPLKKLLLLFFFVAIQAARRFKLIEINQLNHIHNTHSLIHAHKNAFLIEFIQMDIAITTMLLVCVINAFSNLWNVMHSPNILSLIYGDWFENMHF